MQQPRIGGIILAAGRSSRFGSPKQNLYIGGRSLFERSLHAFSGLPIERLVSVIAPMASLIYLCDQYQSELILNNQPERGMGLTIAKGMQLIPDSFDGVLISLVDQPALSSAALAALWDKFQTDPAMVVATHYGESFGPPVIFPSRLFPRLRELNTGGGAKALIDSSPRQFVENPALGLDLDTPEDLANYLAMNATDESTLFHW
jgi:molybdenum cofactor cytidylyltransferase